MKSRLLLCAAAMLLSGSVLGAGHWPSFRGGSASGVGAGVPPTTWDLAAGTNVAWSTAGRVNDHDPALLERIAGDARLPKSLKPGSDAAFQHADGHDRSPTSPHVYRAVPLARWIREERQRSGLATEPTRLLESPVTDAKISAPSDLTRSRSRLTLGNLLATEETSEVPDKDQPGRPIRP